MSDKCPFFKVFDFEPLRLSFGKNTKVKQKVKHSKRSDQAFLRSVCIKFGALSDNFGIFRTFSEASIKKGPQPKLRSWE